MAKQFSIPGIDEIASQIHLDWLGPQVSHHLTATLEVLAKLCPCLFRDIAYCSYAIPDGGPVDGETTAQEDIFTVSVLTGFVRRITDDRSLPFMKSDRDPAWSPSRRALAIHSGTSANPTKIVVLDSATGAVIQTLVPGTSPEWLDAGTILFLDYEPGEVRADVYCVDGATLAVTRITDVGVGASITQISWHPSAGLAVSYAEEVGPTPRYSIAVIPAAAVALARASGTPLPRAAFNFVTPDTTRASAPDWSPTGDRIAISTWTDGSPSRVGILTVATGSIDLVPGPGPAVPMLNDYGPAFSPDGGLIAFTRGEEDSWSEIWLHTIATGHNRQLTDDSQTRFKFSLDW